MKHSFNFVHAEQGMPVEYLTILRSEAFKNKLNELTSSNEGVAKITIKLLDEIALEPLIFIEVSDVYHVNDNGLTSFLIHYHRISSPLPIIFELDSSSDICANLIDAIKSNFNGKRFKAAKLDRKLTSAEENLRTKAYRRYSKRASKCHQKVMGEFFSNPQKPAKKTPEYGVEYRKYVSLADEAYMEVFEPLDNHFFNRLRSISNVAIFNGQKGNAIMMADFITRNIATI